MLALENKKNTRTVTSYNDITKNFFEAKRLTLQEPHKPVTELWLVTTTILNFFVFTCFQVPTFCL